MSAPTTIAEASARLKITEHEVAKAVKERAELTIKIADSIDNPDAEIAEGDLLSLALLGFLIESGEDAIKECNDLVNELLEAQFAAEFADEDAA